MPEVSKGPYADWDPEKDPYLNRYSNQSAPSYTVDPNGAASRIVGGLEVGATVASSLASMPGAGLTGLLMAATPDENRPMGLIVNGRWEPSLFGNVPMPAATAIERIMERGTDMPRTGQGQSQLETTGEVMQTLMSPLTKAVDYGLSAGLDAGLSPESMALPLAGLTSLAEMIPVKNPLKGITRRRPSLDFDGLGKVFDDMRSPGFGGAGEPGLPAIPFDRPLRPGELTMNELQSTLATVSKYDERMNAHFMRGLEGQDLPPQAVAEGLSEFNVDVADNALAEIKIKTDNPGGEWLRHQREDADLRVDKGQKVSGNITAYLEGNKPVMIDPKELESLPGVMGEEATRGRGQKAVDIRESVRSGDPIREPIFITVNHRGEPFISEGNNRMAVAIQEGLTEVPVEVRWYAGGETVDGPLSPEKLKKLARPTQDVADNALAGSGKPPRIKLQGFGGKLKLPEFMNEFEVNKLNPKERIMGDAIVDLRQNGSNWTGQSIRSNKPGAGLKAMKRIIDEADKAGATVTLNAVPFGPGTMSKEQLRSIYAQFGFKPDRDDAMVRIPVTMDKSPARGTLPTSPDDRLARRNRESRTSQPSNTTPDVADNALADRMQPIASRVEAEKRWSDGEDIYAFPDMDGDPIKITDRETLNAYQPDQLGSLGAGKGQRGSVEDTGGGKKVLKTQAARSGLLDSAALEGELLPPKLDRLTAKERKKVEDLTERYPGIRPLLPYLTVNERRHMNKYRAETLEEVWGELDPSEMASVALAGMAKRGWYERSGKAIIELFGEEDAPRFAALLAAMSPQTSVESNLSNALRTWIEWDKSGRPTDKDQILEVMGRSVEGDRGMDSVLGAWQNNSIRALGSSGDELSQIMLSGPKVDSFMRNIWGNFAEVTNDTWVMKYAGLENMFKDHPKVGTINKKSGKPFTALDVAKEKLGGGINAKGTDPGKNGMYLGISAATRKAADLLTKRTGEKWTPAEVQETVWSWTMAMYEKADADVMPVQNLIDKLTHGDVNSTPDFATLLSDPGTYRSIIETGNFNDGIQRLDDFASRGRRPATDPAGTVAQTSGIQPRHLTAAAERLEAGRRTARKPKVLEDLRTSVDRYAAGGQSRPFRRNAAPDSSRNVAATHELSDPKRSQLMNSLGMSTPPVQELKPTAQSVTKFRNAIISAKETSRWGAQVSVKELDDYKNLRLFLTEDGKAGFAINPEDGDMVSLFNAGNSKHEGISTHLVMLAIANGGRKLDNYDTFLSKIYKRLGFEEKSRFPWDDGESPADWDYDTFKDFNDGRPDYVFMEYKPSGKDAKKPGLLSTQSEAEKPGLLNQ